MSEQKTDALRFDSMTIERNNFGVDKGKLRGRVRTSGWDTTLDIALPDDIANKIMEMCAPVIAAQVQISLTDVARDSMLVSMAQDKAMIEAEPQDVVDDNA